VPTTGSVRVDGRDGRLGDALARAPAHGRSSSSSSRCAPQCAAQCRALLEAAGVPTGALERAARLRCRGLRTRKRVSRPAGGQRQRVAIARALATRPPSCCARPPGVDPHTALSILRLLQLNRERGMTLS
jgi:ABC-type glutathione transport system ATPase component